MRRAATRAGAVIALIVGLGLTFGGAAHAVQPDQFCPNGSTGTTAENRATVRCQFNSNPNRYEN